MSIRRLNFLIEVKNFIEGILKAELVHIFNKLLDYVGNGECGLPLFFIHYISVGI